MSRFGSDPRAFFDDVYRAPAPWDIGAAQPDLLRLIEELPPSAPVIDVGCGTGDLTIAMAQRGFDMIGVDFVEAAIDEARRRAGTLPREVADHLRFEVGDALWPSRRVEKIGAVVDSGFMHLFGHETRDNFASDLAVALSPGARYYVLAFAVTYAIDHAPLEMSAAEIETRFAPERGWRLLACRPGEFLSRVATVPAIVACVERRRLQRGV